MGRTTQYYGRVHPDLSRADEAIGPSEEETVAVRQTSPERVRQFSDGVFAVLITILVLELRPPSAHSFSALLPLWPTGLSYVVSYLFIAIVWVNHHHLLNCGGGDATAGVVEFRSSFLGVADSVYHRVDRRQQVGCGAGGTVCGRLRPG
jgi:Endosomal/lysosomal potassium channel TMEM175